MAPKGSPRKSVSSPAMITRISKIIGQTLRDADDAIVEELGFVNGDYGCFAVCQLKDIVGSLHRHGFYRLPGVARNALNTVAVIDFGLEDLDFLPRD